MMLNDVMYLRYKKTNSLNINMEKSSLQFLLKLIVYNSYGLCDLKASSEYN